MICRHDMRLHVLGKDGWRCADCGYREAHSLTDAERDRIDAVDRAAVHIRARQLVAELGTPLDQALAATFIARNQIRACFRGLPPLEPPA